MDSVISTLIPGPRRGSIPKCSKLKLVCPHLGGTLPYIVGRLDHQVQVLKRGPRNLTRAPSEYLKQIWMDIVSPLPLAMKYGYDFIGGVICESGPIL